MNTRAHATEFHEAVQSVVLEAMRRGCAMTTGARLAGCSPAVVCKWVDEGEGEPDGRYGEFAREYRRLQGAQLEEAEQMHRQHRAESPQACQWYMEKLAPETYGATTATVIVQAAPMLPDASPDDVAKALGRE